MLRVMPSGRVHVSIDISGMTPVLVPRTCIELECYFSDCRAVINGWLISSEHVILYKVMLK